jgi:hypothetical protein
MPWSHSVATMFAYSIAAWLILSYGFGRRGVWGVALNTEGQLLASGGVDRTVRVLERSVHALQRSNERELCLASPIR